MNAPRLAAFALLLAPALAAAGVRPACGGSIRVALPTEPRETDPALAATAADLFAAGALHATLLEVDAAGALRPGLLAEVPAPEVGGRAFRLRLRTGLTTSGGAPVTSSDVAAALARLLAREPASPHAWVALPILGAEALLEGRAALLAGVQILSGTELLVTLAFPLPDFPWLLATPAAAIRDTGPFLLAARRSPTDPIVLVQNRQHHRGRPFADALALGASDARGAARRLEAGEVDLVIRPEPAGGVAGAPSPALLVTVAAVNAARLGAGAPAVRSALAGLDRAELARRFVRGPAEPLATLVPAAAAEGAALPPTAPPDPAPGRPPERLVLLVHGTAPDQRAIADRIQVKLFDRGIRASVEVADPARFAARLGAGDYDVALVPVQVLAPRPALAAGQIAFAARGLAAARRVMAALGPLPPEAALAAAARLGRELDLVPLVASGLRTSASSRLQGLARGADGRLDPGDLWLLRGGAR